MKKKILCIDLDGTITDSLEAHISAYQLAAKKNSLEYKKRAEVKARMGPPAEEVVKGLFPKISARKLKAVVKEHNEAIRTKFSSQVKEVPGALASLLTLKKSFKLALISNCIKAEMLTILKGAGIPGALFDCILGKEDIGSKPSKKIIPKIEQLLKAKVEYVIGDTPLDIKTGKLADRKTIAVLSGQHGIKELGKEEPTIIIKSIAVLPDILEERYERTRIY